MLAGEGEGRKPLEKEERQRVIKKLEKEREESLCKKKAFTKRIGKREVFWNTSYFGFASFSFFLFFSQAPALEPWTCDPCILKPNTASQQAGTRTSTSFCFVTSFSL
uniref:Uncharacterized protein n=1 Tax=Gossypium raimondii TaxID=29730 RepID=A0A0D2RK55_GOSRA|nr:hypothetical protein B456_005G231300 [Gossypium raimondii]